MSDAETVTTPPKELLDIPPHTDNHQATNGNTATDSPLKSAANATSDDATVNKDPLSTTEPVPPVAAAVTIAAPVTLSTSTSPLPVSSSIAVDTNTPATETSHVPVIGSENSFSQRLLKFHHALNQTNIPRKEVLDFVFDYGAPDQKNMRSLLWKLSLNYLPFKRGEWENALKRSRAEYQTFDAELSVNPFKDMDTTNSADSGSSDSANKSPTLVMKKVTSLADNPLASGQSQWNEYYKDEAIRYEIDKDVKRTYSSFHFFNERVKPKVISLEEARKAHSATEQSIFDNNNQQTSNTPTEVSRAPHRRDEETHQDVLKRILFIYAKLNPGVRYVQGMNELLAPIYYVFAHDSDPLFAGHAEADAFFCFTNVMSDVRDRFIKSLDHSPSGVLAVVKHLNSMLKDCDEELWRHLDEEKVDPRFYSFRWITLLLSQEFELPEVLRLWDSLFADTNRVKFGNDRFEFLLYTCCSMLVCVRQRLLEGDFAVALKTLQHYNDSGIEFLTILSTASRLKREREERLRDGLINSGESAVKPVSPPPPAASVPTSPTSAGAGSSGYQGYASSGNTSGQTSGSSTPHAIFQKVSSFTSLFTSRK